MRAPYIREFAASLELGLQTGVCSERLSLVKTADGGLDYFSGGASVLFAAETAEHQPFIVKCYRHLSARRREVYRALRERDVTPYGCVGEYFEDALTVVAEGPVEVDVLVMPQLAGVTLEERVAELCREGDREGLRSLADEFDAMAEWLIGQDWAHGDLSPDNIVVTPKGLRLIDFDAAYLPNLTEQRVEIGRAEYNHPDRNVAMDNKHIDDWAIALLSVNLHALAVEPAWKTADELPFLSEHFITDVRKRARELACRLAESGEARAYTLCGVLCEPFAEIENMAEMFAHSVTPPAAAESFNVGLRWGLRCGEKVVEAAVWDDVVRRENGWFGRLNNTFYKL